MSVDIALLGFGAIGRELARQLATNARATPWRVRVCAIIDRSGFVHEPNGFTWKCLMELRAHKANGNSLAAAAGGVAAGTAESLEIITSNRRSTRRSVLVDATAAYTTLFLERAIARGWDLVLANKLPLTDSRANVERLLALAQKRRRNLLYEATVGAGLPVIDTLRKLIESGDQIQSIEGCPSGTLGFIFGELGRGARFSDALRSAVAAGYTEPDPREDLGGADVARKALILGRLIGFRGELGDIAVDSLVPNGLAVGPRDEFLRRVDEIDAHWSERTSRAARRGRVLRYRARVTRRAISVGLVEVDSTSMLATLTGTDNQFAFTTTRYREQPLVITGPGAGAGVTAAGVYNDILAIAGSERRRARRVSASARSPRSAPV
jgi:bifunctional aspartokinase / homoserine dehydrogenase 1